MSTSVSPPTASRTGKSSRSLRRWVIGISLILTTLGLFLLVWTQGHVSGSEFSPSHFQVREFSFYEIPVLRIQITPIKRTGTTPSAALYVRQKTLIKAPAGPPNTWHVVNLDRGFTGHTPADPKLLVDQFKFEKTNGTAYWEQWSIDHAGHAKVFWPIVQKLAQRELYILLPQLFEVALLEQSAAELTERIDQLLRREYHALIQDMRDAERPRVARALLNEALRDYPDDTALRELSQSFPPSDPE